MPVLLSVFCAGFQYRVRAGGAGLLRASIKAHFHCALTASSLMLMLMLAEVLSELGGPEEASSSVLTHFNLIYTPKATRL